MNKLIETMLLVIICTISFNKSVLPDCINKNEIIVGEYRILSTATDEKYAISMESACDKIMETGICPTDCKFLCSGIARVDNENYYVIDSISENSDTVTKEVTFWVQCDKGEVYVYFDPTLHYSDFYKRFELWTDENDGRSRLIKISDKSTAHDESIEQTAESTDELQEKSEYNGYITLITSLKPDTEKQLTAAQLKNIKVILDSMDSSDKELMSVLSLRKETADVKNAPIYHAVITDVNEFDGKTYAIRSYHVIGSSVIFDIWSTDGNTVDYVGDFTDSEYTWMYSVRNGLPVIVTYEFSARGHDYRKTPLIAAEVYTIENGKLKEHFPDEGKQFFWLCEFEDTNTLNPNRLFILDKLEDGYHIAPEEITELVQNGDFNQELMWSDGKITIVSKQSAYSTDISKAIKNKKDVLDKEYAPFGVTSVYEGTPTDMNNDGYDDFVYALSLYNQFQLVVIDSTDGTYLMDEKIMTAFDTDNCSVEIYIDTYGAHTVKAVGRNVYASEAELTETVQIINGEGSFILEAVYDKETNEFLHAYDKYTLEEYQKRQEELLDGCSLLKQITWKELQTN